MGEKGAEALSEVTWREARPAGVSNQLGPRVPRARGSMGKAMFGSHFLCAIKVVGLSLPGETEAEGTDTGPVLWSYGTWLSLGGPSLRRKWRTVLVRPRLT